LIIKNLVILYEFLYQRDHMVCSISILHIFLLPQQIIPNKIWMMINKALLINRNQYCRYCDFYLLSSQEIIV